MDRGGVLGAGVCVRVLGEAMTKKKFVWPLTPRQQRARDEFWCGVLLAATIAAGLVAVVWVCR